MPQQLNVLFSNGKAICFYPTTSLQTREEFELFLEREYEKFYPTDSVSIKNVQYLYVDKSTNTPIKFELPTNWDEISSKCTVKSNIVEVIFGKNPMIFVELDNQPKQTIPQYEIVSPIPASSRKKQIERSSLGTVATSLEFSSASSTTTKATTNDDDEKVVIIDDDSIFDKPLAEKQKEKILSPQKPSTVIVQQQQQPTTVSYSDKPTSQNSQDSTEIDFDEEIIFSDTEEHVEKQLVFPSETTQKSNEQQEQKTESNAGDDISPLMDDILSQSNEEPVKMNDDLGSMSNADENILCTQAVDTPVEESPKDEDSNKQQQEIYMSPSKQFLSTPQKSSQTKSTTPKKATPNSSQEQKVQQQNNVKPAKQQTPKTPISIISKIKNFKTPNPSQSSREDVMERSKTTTKKRKREQLSTFIAKKAIDTMSTKKKNK